MKQFTPPEIAKAIAITSFSALTAIAAAPAQAVVMDFNSLANGTRFTTYTEQGFKIDQINGVTNGELQALNNSGLSSIGITNGTTSPALVRLTKVDGGSFALSSIDLDTALAPAFVFGAASVLFTGTTATNTTVTQSFTTDTTDRSYQTFAFNSSFTDLVSVDVAPSSPTRHLFDNINVSASASTTAVPEPFTILGTLFGAGYGIALKRKLAKAGQEEREEEI
jgi:hypothetical protein